MPTRIDVVKGHLRAFEQFLVDVPPFTLPDGSLGHWKPFTVEEVCKFDPEYHGSPYGEMPHFGNLKYESGVYIIWDYCTSDDAWAKPSDGSTRYQVARYIGKTERSFQSRMRTYKQAKKPQSKLPTSWHWIDAIPIYGEAQFLIPALERYLQNKMCWSQKTRGKFRFLGLESIIDTQDD